MVTAGVYMVARMNFLYVITPFAMTVIATIGALTAFFAATIGIAQNDIKKVLAYSTISQIGFMMVGVGVGAFSAGIFHLVTHSFFKACLFLCAGSVMHALSGELDIRNMGGLKRYLPWTRWTFLLATLAIAGCPFFSGFFSKDEILWKAFSTVNPIITWWPTFIWAVSLIAAFCTAFYMFRLYFLTFEGSCRVSEKLLHHIHESPKIMVGPLVILAGLSVIGGFIGMPHMFGVHNIFDEFLEPVFASASSYITPFYSLEKLVGMESILMVLSILVFWAGLSIAHYIYAKEDLKEAEMLAQQYPKIHKTLVQKYKIDEFYNWLVVEPSKWISEKFYRIIDVWVIDKVMVNGSAWIMKICGRILSYLQNGLVQRYAAIMAIGVIIFLYVFSSPSPEFSVNIKGNTVQVTATPKSGYKYRWDFNGDGHWDTSFSEDHRQRYTFRKKGDYTIILEIENRWGIKKKEEVDIEIK
jgi:NADH-quinone oxidoreductase subunit L